MLPAERLKLAISIHSKCYKLLGWVSDAIKRGFIPLTRAHEYSSMADSSYEWVVEHYDNLPTELRPERRHLREFSNYFSTYLSTSFDLIEQPEQRLKSKCGCYCPLCRYLVQAPHLQLKKVLKKDKNRAVLLMEYRLQALAREEEIDVNSSTIAGVLKTEAITTAQAESKDANIINYRRLAAYSTYGYWLLQRLDGYSDGVSLLALWREIAYEPAGSPMQNFKLKYEDFAKAEVALVAFFKLSHSSLPGQ